MTFARPAVLVLLVVLPLLLALYRRLQSMRARPVTTYLLFERVANRMNEEPRRRSIPWRELVRLAPLLLVIVALAAPGIEVDEERLLVALVDPSISMGTVDDGKTRLERGLAALDAALESSGQRYRIIDSESAASLRSRALQLTQSGEQVIVVTDREIEDLPADAGLIVVGDRIPNAGITICALNSKGQLLVRGAARGNPGVRSLYFGFVQKGVDLEVSGVRTSIASWPFRIVLGPWEHGEFDSLRVRIEPGDANTVDDEVQLRPAARRPIIRLPLQGHDDLERAFSADASLDCRRGPGPADLVVGAASDGRTWALNVAPTPVSSFRFGEATRIRGPLTVGGALTRFPLGEEVADDLVFPIIESPESYEVLVAAGDTPLLVRAGRDFVLLVDPARSQWRSRRSFPLLCSEIVGLMDVNPDSFQRFERSPAAVAGPFADADQLRLPRSGEEDQKVDLSLVAWATALALLLLLCFEGRTFRRG